VEAHAGLQPSPQEINTLVALFTEGRYTEAATLAQTMTVRFPLHAFGWRMLGLVFMQMGRSADALVFLQKAAVLSPDDAGAYSNLGNALKELGRLNEAEVSYRRALQIKPDYAAAHNNLGIVFNDLGRLEEAEASYRLAIQIKPDFAEAHSNLGNTLKELGQLEEGGASCRRALVIQPDFADAHYNLGTVLQELGQLDDAMASYRRALEVNPDFVDAHNNLGTVLQELGQLDDAMASYRRTLKTRPDDANVHSNLGTVLQELGQLDDAMASYRRALRLQPHILKHAIHAHLALPIIFDTSDAVAACRERYQTGIAALMETLGTLEKPGTKVGTYPFSFYLAYHNYNDRAVMEALCHFLRGKLPDVTTTSPHVLGWHPPTTRGRCIRVGFLSQFLVGHTIGQLFQGFIQHLDRSRFEVVVIHTPKAKRDSFSQNIDALADRVLNLPAQLESQQQAVMAEKLDVLFYPDIGMAASTYFLAFARLAPVQAVSWGHPDTTGLDTMDYFVSAAPIEPENAEEHYTERLIRLNRMPCFYQPVMVPTQILGRAALGLPETGTLYGCPQSLFKLHPDFDGVLAAIAVGDPAGHIVLLEGKHSAWATLLKDRWAKNAPLLLERVLFLPHQPLDRFMALISHMDVLLDPIYFGSGNTLYQAMVYGTPVVTWPGPFMRGRIVAGAYRQMGIADAPIALHLQDYANVALALGRDPERNHALRQTLREAANLELLADMRAVREFEIFLEAAVAAAGRGEQLPTGWKPKIQEVQ